MIKTFIKNNTINRVILISVLSFMCFFILKSNVHAATITMPSTLEADTTSYVLLSSSGTTSSVSGFSTDLIITLSVTSGTIKITTSTGLTAPTGYGSGDWTGSSTIAFEGSQTNVNNALATLSYQGSGSSSTTLEASATPTGAAYNPDNGHYYKLSASGLNWDAAKIVASSSSFNGLTGYLATITSSSENDFVKSKVPQGSDAWYGASDAVAEGASEGEWEWATGPEAGTKFWTGGLGGSVVPGFYEDWNVGEPNNVNQGDAGFENYLAISNSGGWNDYVPVHALDYVIEYGGLGGETATVEDSTNIIITNTQDSDPLLLSSTPADDATGVATDSSLVITFTETVDAESGNITLYKSDDTLVQQFDVTSDISGSGTDTITINPTADLDDQTSYYLQIDATAFDDTAGNSYAGISNSTTYSFTTADETNPTVSTLSPADGATGVAINSNIVATFDEAVDAESGYITLYKSDGTQIEQFDVTSNISGSGTAEITIDPTSDLNNETQYYIQIDATAFDDATGNSYAGISDTTSWAFITPTCPTIDNTATYNAYPTCGVATCNDGYTLSDGTCNASGGGARIILPSIGIGQTDTFIPMYKLKPIHKFNQTPINVLMFIDSTAEFSAVVSKTQEAQVCNLKIANLDMISQKIKVEITPNHQILELDIEEAQHIDLDNDNINDIKLTYNELLVNRIDLTFEQLSFQSFGNNKLIKYADSPKIYLLTDGVKHWIYDEKTFNYFNYNWDEIITINSNLTYPERKIIKIKDQKTEEYKKAETEFTRDLFLGSTGGDVKQLQIYLNNNGSILTESGPGSPGEETMFFGRLTKEALIKFQKNNSIAPSIGYFGPITRGILINKQRNLKIF
ncbi:MAG: Ig-like domain-containing protein [Patescibacteria group bacterium]|nr:Ig-like domain-containing protein [Patescibacteria group bacterium]